MDKGELKYTVETFKSDPDVKAYIYQQLVEFEPYLLPGSHIAVLIRNQNKKNKGKIAVTFALSAEGGQILGKGLAIDVFEAAKLAKEDVLRQFESIQNQVINAVDRDHEISQIMAQKSPHTLH